MQVRFLPPEIYKSIEDSMKSNCVAPFIVLWLISCLVCLAAGWGIGESEERNYWKNTIRSKGAQHLVNIVEKEDAFNKAKAEYENARDGR